MTIAEAYEILSAIAVGIGLNGRFHISEGSSAHEAIEVAAEALKVYEQVSRKDFFIKTKDVKKK